MAIATLIVAGLGLVLLAIGAYLAWTGLRTYRHSKTLASASPFTDTTGPDTITTVEGTVTESIDGDSLEGHFTGTPCVAYSCQTLEEESADGEAIYDSSNTIRKRSQGEAEAVPFVVDSDGRRVRVEASDAHVVWSGADFESVSAASMMRNQGTLRALLRLLRSIPGSGRKRHRYFEATLLPGDRVSAIGSVRRADGDGVTLAPAGGAPLVVSTDPRRDVAGGFRTRATSSLIGSVILGGGGGLLLLALAGVV